MKIHTWCSPDADDRFMMWAIETGRIPTGEYEFVIRAAPTDALNEIAIRGEADVCAVSFGSWPRLADRWLLLPHGGSMGEGYGPVVVAREPMTVPELARRRVAVPGTNTTAWLVLKMIAGELDPVVVPIVPYARIFDALAAGEVDAGLVIHEGRLTYERLGFHRIVDLGEWFAAQTRDAAHPDGLPLPLGANVIRADLPPADIARISEILRDAIRYGLDHRDEAIAELLAGGGALGTAAELDRYLGMYANERTWDYGEAGRAGITELFRRAGAPAPRWAP